MELEFRHLRIVIAVADEGSITKAAASLGLSQPSLTSQLQRIERAMGAPLFERARTGVVPTSFGRTVLAKARSVVNEMADLRGEAQIAVSPDSPVEVRLGGRPSALLPLVVPRLVELWIEVHGPGVPTPSVQVHSDPSAAALQGRVRAGRLDAAVLCEVIGYEVGPAEGVHRDVVVEQEPDFVALSERHPLAAQDVIDLADLAQENWMIDPQEDNGGIGPLRAACRAAGFEPRVTHEISDANSAREFVNSGQCVSLAQPTSREGRGLIVRPLRGDPIRTRLELAWRDPCPIDPMLLRRAIIESYERLVDRNPHYPRWWAEHGPGPLNS
ncbi:LysR family transcriptional regulator [Actinokineospora sp. NBRC 105648]|uniref:LysR family transcriptional regulator n=1 Tax=Actinokineospora sp. NBRC 105648 TaxID=3032206 RepID=UPI0024A01048|nr:LysR family transcriptional regulator [Actinokineospora sp. NBRC 105648]GLZ42440.1 small neutral protease regulatory protein [Actinokineospora sp. NBRC 105648]